MPAPAESSDFHFPQPWQLDSSSAGSQYLNIPNETHSGTRWSGDHINAQHDLGYSSQEHPSPENATSPANTLDPSDSVSRSHSPQPSHSTTSSEMPASRQTTDVVNMGALGDILAGAERHQKQLRMARLKSGAKQQQPVMPVNETRSLPGPATETTPPKRKIAPLPVSRPIVIPSPPAAQAQAAKSPSQRMPALSVLPPGIHPSAQFMPPDPFASDAMEVIPSSSAVPRSPPAAPFKSHSPPSYQPLGYTTNTNQPQGQSQSQFIPDYNSGNGAIWTKDIVVIGIYTNRIVTSTGLPAPIPVALAASPKHNVQPETWPSSLVIHGQTLHGPLDLSAFHNTIQASGTPQSILLPHVPQLQVQAPHNLSDENANSQLECLTAYKRITHTLLERKSFARITFDVPSGPKGTGIAIYPHFDHQAGGYRLLAAFFGHMAVPIIARDEQVADKVRVALGNTGDLTRDEDVNMDVSARNLYPSGALAPVDAYSNGSTEQYSPYYLPPQHLAQQQPQHSDYGAQLPPPLPGSMGYGIHPQQQQQWANNQVAYGTAHVPHVNGVPLSYSHASAGWGNP